MIEIANGLQFPEGPIAMPDGSVLLVEIKRGDAEPRQPERGDIRRGPHGRRAERRRHRTRW